MLDKILTSKAWNARPISSTQCSLILAIWCPYWMSIHYISLDNSQGNLSLSKFMWLQLIGGLYGCHLTFDCVFFQISFCFTVKKFLCMVGCTWISISFLDSNEIFCMNSVFLSFSFEKGLLYWNSVKEGLAMLEFLWKWSVCLHQGEYIGILDKMGC